MNILIYDINYSPELTGVGKYTGEMGAWLVKQGHSVHVITAMPYYPEWEVHASYKGKLWFTERIEGATVHRCPFYVPKKVTPLKRVLHEFSFIVSSLVYWIPALFRKRYDVIICVAPPFHIGLLPVLYSKLRKTSLWIHLQDLVLPAYASTTLMHLVMYLAAPLVHLSHIGQSFLTSTKLALQSCILLAAILPCSSSNNILG